MLDINARHYLESLELWFKSTEKYLYQPPGRAESLCYGTGYDIWGVQTHQKALAAYGVAAADPNFDELRAGVSRDELFESFRKMLRFNLESHVVGPYKCLDNHSWGNTWISGLGLERMAHAIEALEDDLIPEERDLLRRVLISECDWLTDEYEIVAAPDAKTHKNNPESNLWNGALLCRTATKYPDHPRAEEYWERGVCYLVNSNSIPADAESKELFDGKTLAERHVGANYFPSFSLDHHCYLNIGYIVICLSNVAMAHFWFKKRGLKPPESLYLHVDELWRLVKTCIFPDGRLWRIGGDNRVRYCYCQDYLIPSLLFVRDYLGDTDTNALESAWFSLLINEQKSNTDGSYLGDRLSELPSISPLYYTRLESDRAGTVSTGAYWRRIYDELRDSPTAERNCKIHSDWSEPFHGACLVRGERRFASRVWRATALSTVNTCVPANRGDMAEWSSNMSGEILGLGSWHADMRGEHREWTFSGGFLTIGDFIVRCGGHMEGQHEEDFAHQWQVMCALPDDATVIGLQFAKTLRRVYLKSVKGLKLNMPNDIFNQKRRKYVIGGEEMVLEGPSSKEEIVKNGSNWLNIDDCLGVVGLYGADELSVYRPGRRNIDIFSSVKMGHPVGTLHADQICAPIELGMRDYDADATLYDIGFAVIAGSDRAETESFAQKPNCRVLNNNENGIRALEVTGIDAKRYLLVANFAETELAFDLSLEPEIKAKSLTDSEDLIADSKGSSPGKCEAMSAQLFQLQSEDK